MNKKDKTIIHIEDDENQRLLFEKKLIKKYNYIGTELAEEAEDILVDEKPPLIILDLSLPLMNGFEFLKKNKINISDKKIPVIVTTGLVSPNIKVLCREHGCDSLYTKPLEYNVFFKKIDDIILEYYS